MSLIVPPQELLLQAALQRCDQAQVAWRKWLELSYLEHEPLESGSNALLPLIYGNLTMGVSVGVDKGEAAMVPLLGRLRGIYRRTWYTNETCFRTVGAALVRLADTGIPVLLPDGAAMALRFYQYHAFRPVGSQIVWVRAEQVLAAVHSLRQVGWQVATRLPAPMAALRNMARQTWPLRDRDGHVLLVHGRSWSGRLRALWSTAVPLSVGAGHGLALNPTEQLIFISAQASCARPGLALPFLADAVQLIRSSGAAIDWDLIRNQAAARAFVRQVMTIGEEMKELSMKLPMKGEGIL